MENFNTTYAELDAIKATIDAHKLKLASETNILTISRLNVDIQKMTDRIAGFESKRNLYVSSTFWLLEAFKKYKKEPIVIDFTSNYRSEKKVEDTHKQNIINQYLAIAERFIDVSPYIIKKIKPVEVTAKEVLCDCGKKMRYINDEMVCNSCGIKSNELESFTTYKDIDRVNIASNYQYDMRQHLRNTLDHYQGKEKTAIPKEVYERIETHVVDIGLDIKEITHTQILYYMKLFGFSKYYDNVNKIHHELTGIPLPDLTDIEDLVLKDIDAISNIFHEVKEDRKNFINAQLTICMLLTRNGYPCSLRDFHNLKTFKRFKDHLNTYRKIEERLGWTRTMP